MKKVKDYLLKNILKIILIALVIVLIIEEERHKCEYDNPRSWLPIDTFAYKDSGYIIRTHIDSIFYSPESDAPQEDYRDY